MHNKNVFNPHYGARVIIYSYAPDNPELLRGRAKTGPIG
jgi:hypothetical protein